MLSISEEIIENDFMAQLERQGFERVKIENNKKLEENLKLKLEELNKNVLEGGSFTENEFRRILSKLKSKSKVFDCANLLRSGDYLDLDTPLNNNKQINIKFFKINEWCQNIFQCASQVTLDDGKYRLDVMLLINGFPMVVIELKRRNRDIKEALTQLNEYKNKSFTYLYKYVQLFIVSNATETKYFSNNDGEILSSNLFYWSDENNKQITSLMSNDKNSFTSTFLEKCMVSKIIAKYMILNNSTKKLMVMRPYQIHATEKAIHIAKNLRNNVKEDTIGNCYIWHTTGSGKTLTSFVLSKLLAQEEGIKKVIFLVDRMDLDSQTQKEFNSFDEDYVVSIDKSENLAQAIVEKQKVIVTTIQKMNNVVTKENYKAKIEYLKNERVVFIIDECHRSQFGDMHNNIKRFFDNAQYIGFTGTPIFEENQNADKRKTADIFGKLVHEYKIKDAIHDGNVLPFSVEYHNVNKMKNSINKEYVHAINTKEVLYSDERINEVAKHIIQIHDKKTHNKKYCAIFAVSSISMVVKYYEAFKRLEHDLKITAVFSTKAEYESDEINKEEQQYKVNSKEELSKIVKDYNEQFGKKFDLDSQNVLAGDIANKIKNEKKIEIDILIVANMFLTGFDSKMLNTLYVDKNLQYHGLLQAFSRTNRTYESDKSHGNIVCYRNLKNEVKEAVTLFSSDNEHSMFVKNYEEYEQEFKDLINYIKSKYSTPDDLNEAQHDEDKKDFVVNFRELLRVFTKIKTFKEFDFKKEIFGMDLVEYEEYGSKYKKIYNDVNSGRNNQKEKTSVLEDICFEVELLGIDMVDVTYILNLMYGLQDKNILQKEQETNEIKHKLKLEIEKYSKEELTSKYELILKFLDENGSRIIKDDLNFEEEYINFENAERFNYFKEITERNKITEDELNQLVEVYIFDKNKDFKTVSRAVIKSKEDLKGRKMREAKKQLRKDVEMYCNKFNPKE